MSAEDADWTPQVLNFWFEELTKKDWFQGSDHLDKSISDRFGALHKRLTQGSATPTDASGKSTLAAVIVLDQFSRNMYRGTKQAFEYDAMALGLTKQALEQGLEEKLNDDEKQFLFMPLMHSEKLEDQALSVELFTQLGAAEYAVEHMDVIEKFGRFPHRNDVLGRESTEAEIEYLQNARRYGQ